MDGFYITSAASRPTQTLSFSAISLIMGSLKRPHAVVVPFPAQGHINPCMQLAKLLHSRGFYISFVNTEFNHSRLVRSKGPDFVKGLQRFHFEVMPDGLPPSDRDATQDVWALCDSVRKNCLGPFRELLAKLNSSTSWPPVTCIISDGIMSFAVKAAEELRIPEVQFWTASACGFMGYLQFSELINRGIVPFKDEKFLSDHSFLDTSIDWIPGMSNIRLKDIPSFIRTTDREDIMLNFMSDEAQNCLQSPAIIFNTLDDFEHQLLEAIAAKFPRIYTVGPLSLLEKQMPECEAKSLRCSLWKEDSECLEWLDRQDPDSVVYVSYGCITVMSDQQLQEFAWGLASSKYPFLWVVRPDAVMGSSAILPEEYYEEIKHRGLLVSWCPQEQVLCHPSVGVFITHCGWNSVLESICGAKPVICWPFFAEQLTNCRYLCGEWGIGLEINREVKREEIRSLVEEVIEGEKGKQMKKKALEWKKKAEEATVDGGSSHLDFDRFIKEALQYDN